MTRSRSVLVLPRLAAPLVALLVALLAAVLAPAAGAQGIKLTLKSVAFEPAVVGPGGETALVIEVEPDVGWHLYGAKEEIGLPPALSMDSATTKGRLTRKGGFQVPDGKSHDAGGLVSWWLEGKQTFRQVYTVPADAEAGAHEIQGVLKYMVCDPTMCLPPSELDLAATLTIDAAAAAADGGEAVPEPSIGLNTGHLKVRSLSFEPAEVAPGGTTVLRIEVAPDFGWHFYGALEENGAPPALSLDLPAGVARKGGLKVPDGAPHDSFGMISHWVATKSVLEQAVTVAADAAPGVKTLKGVFSYTACNDQFCDPTLEVPIGASFRVAEVAATTSEDDAGTEDTVGDGSAGAAAGGDDPAADGGSGFGAGSGAGVEEQPLGLFLLAAFLAGLLALVMPCTYPMIPITISFFTKQASDRGGSVLPLSLAYGAGIIGIFIAIGVVVGPAIVPFAQHPVTNLIIGALFVVFALSLFGLFYLQPPEFLMRGASAASRQGGFGGVFLMGMTLCVTSFTCTAPFVGTLLAAGAKSGSYSRVALGMAVFGLTMAVPFVLLSLVPGRIQSMPKSGSWMNTVKVSLGFLELAAALKFFSNAELGWGWNVLPRELFLIIWAAIFLAASLYLFGFVKLKGESGEIGPGRMLAAIISLILTFAFFYGGLGYRFDNIVMQGLEPPYSATASAGGRVGSRGEKDLEHPIVKDDFDGALRVAQEQGRAVLVNFTGFV